MISLHFAARSDEAVIRALTHDPLAYPVALGCALPLRAERAASATDCADERLDPKRSRTPMAIQIVRFI